METVPLDHRSTAVQSSRVCWCLAAAARHRWTNYHYSVLELFFFLWRHKTRIQKQSGQSVARPTLGQITATHQPLAARTPSQGAITSSLHRRGPDGQVYRFWFPSLLLPPSSRLLLLRALCFCEMKCNDQLRWKFPRRLKMELCGPSLPPEFLKFALLGKMNGSLLYGTALSSLIVSCYWREWLNI